ncbi:2-amino-3,7-dideoxy-D-threo-hept-6-ulosonate synthase [Actinokineospora sp. UTMC 2448]|uniref:2-amino-3,7-dideoxy-D-threo-hept-6-ulosonate synthase n=1 Tax=Actinokineospora sp. UTMC 2448 TaxID=2268449 RepID=UPI002164DB07|nr:2-amino-3,7-dideoxy-D-threo-hept-6-ulosonate synthase [Actinokineospora sp. UTMC 2448]UVS81455.1 2-amino-4,5-dihydroxy-6-one-heptanoic acid-7-phosphate synthase [Actinokineospora sp. UTMC 2448]
MITTTLTGKSLRLARLSRSGDGRFLFVPLDHSVSDGPIGDVAGFPRLVEDIVAGGADGVVVHKGRARLIPASLLSDCGLIVHLSASTAHAPDVNAKVLVGEVDEAVRLGADAVSVHVNIGSDTEAAQLGDLGMVASECDRWGVPLLAMIYPRGPRIDNPGLPELIAHAANIAADLGADMVKTVMAQPIERMADVVASSPLPVVVAGGGSGGDPAGLAASALAAGCRGLAVGRRVFTSASPRLTVAELAAIVHGRAPSTESEPRTRLAGVL